MGSGSPTPVNSMQPRLKLLSVGASIPIVFVGGQSQNIVVSLLQPDRVMTASTSRM